MRRCLGFVKWVLTVVMIAGASCSTAQAQTTSVPRLIRFSGAVPNTTGTVGVTFALYKDQSGGAPLWLETQSATLNERGQYTVLLGANHKDGVPLDLFASGEARWIGVQAEGQSELPRLLLVSVPYALKAADAETLGGLPASAYVLATPATNLHADGTYVSPSTLPISLATAGTAGYLGKFTSAGDLGNSVIYETDRKIGIGTTTPESILDIKTTNSTQSVKFNSQAWAIRLGYLQSGIQFLSMGIIRPIADNNYIAYSKDNPLVAHTALEFGYDGSLRYKQQGHQPDGTTLNLATAFHVDKAGRFGIATATPTEKLEVVGNIKITGTGNGVKFPDGTVQKTAATSGTVAAVTPGDASIAVGGTATAPTVSVANGGISTAKLADAAVTASKISGPLPAALISDIPKSISAADSSVTIGGTNTAPTVSVSPNGITTAKIANRAVTADKIAGPLPATLMTGVATLGANSFSGAQAITATGNSLTVSGGATGVSSIGTNTGIYGTATNATYSFGAYGKSPNAGVGGESANVGVYGYANTNSGIGLWGTTYATSAVSGPSYTGVFGAGGDYGVYGYATNAISYGVYGNGPYVGVRGDSTDGGWGIYGKGYTGVFSEGNFAATGTKSAIVPLDDGRAVTLYAIESTENWFEDFGSARLVNGSAVVAIDPMFAGTISIASGYQVFLTPNGDCKGLYVAQKTATTFEVHELGGGRSNVGFDYRIVAHRRGYEDLRMAPVQADTEAIQRMRDLASQRRVVRLNRSTTERATSSIHPPQSATH